MRETTRGILLVLVASRNDRLPTTELYRRHFLGVVHLMSGQEKCPRGTSGHLCLHVNSKPHYIYHETIAKVCVALARARAASREAHRTATQGRRLTSRLTSQASPEWLRASPAWVRTLSGSVGDGRLRLATGVLVAHMDFWMRPPSFGSGLRRDLPWRLPRGLMPKHPPGAIRLLRPLNVTAAGGAAGAAVEGASYGARGAVVRIRGMQGLRYQRYGPKGGVPILVISNHTDFVLPGGGVAGGSTLAPPGALPPPLGVGQRHHAAYQLHDYYFGGCYSGERLHAEKTWFWGYGSKACGAKAAANLSGVLPRLPVAAGAARVMSDGSVCAGWSDLYHVPLKLASEFALLSRHYRHHNVWHEVAVATILHILSNASSPLLEEVVSGCFGCCCCGTDPSLHPAELIAQYPCGHRLNLKDSRATDALRGVLLREV